MVDASVGLDSTLVVVSAFVFVAVLVWRVGVAVGRELVGFGSDKLTSAIPASPLVEVDVELGSLVDVGRVLVLSFEVVDVADSNEEEEVD